uniref:Putative transcription factor hand2/transcription factor n=1 Tax=Panstrongylus lignarius TaxID=156445 RepID=A0A224XZR8_9HEMI
MSYIYSYAQYPYSHESTAECENEERWWWTGDGASNAEIENNTGWDNTVGQQVVRVVRRRTTANKKERRRTQSINNAFAELRECIPNVPADTKLSKIKTLRLATSYIGYLLGVLETEDFGHGFKADISHSQPKRASHQTTSCEPNCDDGKRSKGRTGWPQHVWALELKSDTV